MGTAQFYKKDAVCYAGGVIKVVSDENNVAAVLTKDGSPVTSQNITNGETIFKNLPAGTYSVNVGGLAKKITINQK